MIEFKVVSGATNVLLLVNGKGIPAQVEKRDGNVLYRFIVRDDRLHEFFPERTCSFEEFDQDDYPVLDSVCGDGFCGACWGVIEAEDSHCKHCGAKVVER